MNVVNFTFNPKNINSFGLILLFLMREFIRKTNIFNILIYFGGLSILNYLFFIYNYWIPLKIKNIPPKIIKTGGKERGAGRKDFIQSQISVLWYNTYSLPFFTSRIHIQSVIDYVYSCMTKHKVNVIGLCEVWLNRDAQYISKYMLEMLGSNWNVYISSKNKIIGDGIVLFWNQDEVHIGTLFSTKYGFSTGIDAFVSKGFVSTLITPFKTIDDKKILSQNQSQKIIFTHMQDFIGKKSEVKSEAHEQQLKQLHDSIIYNYPTFIIGDLNFEFANYNGDFCSNFKLVPTSDEYKSGIINFNRRTTCHSNGRLYSFDFVLKEKTNSETTSRFKIIRDAGIFNPSDHEAILFTLF